MSCAGAKRTVGGWFGGDENTREKAASTPRTYYSGVDGLRVYAEPSGSAKVVGRLALHEKVTRTRVERGFGYVESPTSSVKGWVDNARLLWRIPAAGSGEPAEAKPEEPEPPAAPAPEEPAPSTTTTTAPKPRRSTTTLPGVPPSIFNPY